MTDYDPISLSALEHFQYCPRQCALIHVDQVWLDNAQTIRGQHGHRRVDHAPSGTSRGTHVLRGLDLWSERLGLVGRADAVEVHPNGRVVPIEYKIGRRHGTSADIQLCAQAMCLEEMSGLTIEAGYLWLGAHRNRHRVVFDELLRHETLDVIAAVRQLVSSPGLPPAPDDDRCHDCQFVGYCIPGLVAHPQRVDRYISEELFLCEP